MDCIALHQSRVEKDLILGALFPWVSLLTFVFFFLFLTCIHVRLRQSLGRSMHKRMRSPLNPFYFLLHSRMSKNKLIFFINQIKQLLVFLLPPFFFSVFHPFLLLIIILKEKKGKAIRLMIKSKKKKKKSQKGENVIRRRT